MKSKRIMAVALAALMLMGTSAAIQGCSKGVGKPGVIQSGDTWYSAKEIDLNSICGTSDYESVNFQDFKVVDDYILASFSGFSYDDENHIGINDNITCIFNSEGELLNRLNLQEAFGNNDGGIMQILGCSGENGTLYCYYSEINWQTGKNTVYKVKIDPKSGELGEPSEVDFGMANGDYVEQLSFCDVYMFAFKQSGSNFILYVYKDGEPVLEKDLKNVMSTEYIYVSDISSEGDKIKLFISNSAGLSECEYDIKANDFKNVGAADYLRANGKITGFDGKHYSLKADGIYTEDEQYLAFGDTDGNLYRLSQARLGSVQENRVVLFGNGYDSNTFEAKASIIILEKAKKNPNAGKTLLTAEAPYSMVDEMTAEGIRIFNSENTGYYIRTTSDDMNSDPDFDYSDDASWEKYENDFKMRVLSDDGPDIIFKASEISGLNSEQYLMDLNSDITLDLNMYYTNISDKLAVDGKLYCMPLSFLVEGIITDGSLVNEDAKGFTFDEYKELVDKVCNGQDPMADTFSRETYLLNCLNTSGDLWFKEGKVNFNQDAFKQTAEYIRNNVPEKANLMDDNGVVYMDSDYLIEQSSKQARTVVLFTCGNFITESSTLKDPVVLGYPSYDGRGSVAQVQSSVSVSASTEHKDGCIEFVKTLLRPEIQELCESNPFSKEAAGLCIDKAIQGMDDRYKKYIEDQDLGEYDALMMGLAKAPEGTKERYLKTLEDVECVYSFDSAISTIVTEEAGAYFSGQKDIDTFIANLENRVQTVLNEKGE